MDRCFFHTLFTRSALKPLPDLLEKLTNGQLLGADLLAGAAPDAVGGLTALGGDPVVVTAGILGVEAAGLVLRAEDGVNADIW